MLRVRTRGWREDEVAMRIHDLPAVASKFAALLSSHG